MRAEAIGGNRPNEQPTPEPEVWRANLLESGLSNATIQAAGIDHIPLHLLLPFAKKATDSYQIPYFDIEGRRLKDFWRIRWIPEVTDPDGKPTRYHQPPNSGTHLYLPPPPVVVPARWKRHLNDDSLEDIFITEGEKKALKAAQEGLLCIGLGGVNNWKSKSSRFPAAKAKTSKDGKYVDIAHDSEDPEEMGLVTGVCPEFSQIPWDGRRVFIVYDAEPSRNENVEAAAFNLAIWLYEHGSDVFQVILPQHGPKKIGLDDFLVNEGIASFRRLLPQAEFPVHPHTARWVQKTLGTKGSRRDANIKVARAVIAGLDHHGRRYVDSERHFYYFDNGTKKLHDFELTPNDVHQMRMTSFGDITMAEFGIRSTDTNSTALVADDFKIIGPPGTITPHKVVHSTTAQNGRDTMYYQMGDSRVARVSADSITFVDNGTDGVLFRSGVSVPANESEVEDALAQHGRPQDLWFQALQQFSIQPLYGLDLHQSQILLSALFHLNPWLKRWRGLMLPFELAIAEPNSGKTFLYNLRRGILTGNPSLDNVPTDMRSFYAQAKDAPAMWICDNLGEMKRDERESFSDECARLITEPDPHTTTRKLFTTSESYRIDISCTFAATAIRNPFWKPDILQRAFIYSLHAIPAGQRDSNWYLAQLDRRAVWVAEHLLAIKRFFQIVRPRWQPHYLSGHRLTNFEQSVGIMITALGHESESAAIVSKLQDIVQYQIAEHDPMMDALRTFAREFVWPKADPIASLGDIVDWVASDPDNRFTHLRPLRNPLHINRYFNSHEYDIRQSAGLTRFEYKSRTCVTPTGSEFDINAHVNGHIQI
jgi:hypothetical protein